MKLTCRQPRQYRGAQDKPSTGAFARAPKSGPELATNCVAGATMSRRPMSRSWQLLVVEMPVKKASRREVVVASALVSVDHLAAGQLAAQGASVANTPAGVPPPKSWQASIGHLQDVVGRNLRDHFLECGTRAGPRSTLGTLMRGLQARLTVGGTNARRGNGRKAIPAGGCSRSIWTLGKFLGFAAGPPDTCEFEKEKRNCVAHVNCSP